MGSTDSTEDLSPLAETFAAFLEEHRDGKGIGIEEFCGAHPEQAAGLRGMYARWRALEGTLGRIGDGARESVDTGASGGLIADLRGGARSERYEVGREIARGGMGAVLEVFDRDLRRTLAMKVLLGTEADGGLDPRTLSRFLEEAQITGQLEHPGIPPVHELGLDAEGRVFFTMRLVDGANLQEIIERVRAGREGWTLTRALGVIVRVCEAMGFAHAKGVLHRDLKPANVMVGAFGETYVMDWGLARVLDGAGSASAAPPGPAALRTVRSESEADSPLSTRVGDVVGTPVYMAPEQAGGRIEELGPASDVYAIGAMLYHLLTGCRPYLPPGQERGAAEVLRLVQERAPRPVHALDPSVPAELEAICDKAMARDPRDRYPSTGALAEDLRAFLDARVVAAYQTGALAELSKWVQRNRKLALALAVAVLAVVGGLAVSATMYLRAEEQRARVMRLADLDRLEELEERAAELYPPYPERIDDYVQWLADAGTLAARLEEEHRPTLGEFEAARASETPEQRWHRASLADLVTRLEAFTDPEVGRMADVAQRLERARSISEETVTGPGVAALWREAIASIADPAECPAYGGLEIVEQVGLVPLGRDPRSGLWEFGHLWTGRPPERAADGELVLTEDTGVVLVLLPGADTVMGVQREVPGLANYDPRARANEGPPIDIHFNPFLISKYEMTQGQWRRMAGTTPSFYVAEGQILDRTVSWLHPVEQVSWEDCARLLPRVGLELPTEFEWEYAARGGTTTPWYTGPERESLRGHANLADQTAADAGVDWTEVHDWPDLVDGFPAHAPIGSFEPNPFGLHSTVGNVWEWTASLHLDFQVVAGLEPDPGDVTDRVSRGGSFTDTAANARVAVRMPSPPNSSFFDLGVRPARTLDTERR